jgi:predicted dehydrogenase
MKETPPLKGVCIGAGYFSQYHLQAWQRIPEAAITGLCDLDRDRAERRMAAYGISSCYRDFREMIDKESPDFVDIVTPPATHLPIVRYAAERGIHVLCQKPLAPSFEESLRIVETARQGGIRLMVNDNWRWQPWYREIKRVVDGGAIGRATFGYFQMRMGDGWGENAYLERQPFFREYEKLLIYETGVHFIDTFRFLFGEVASVYAHLTRLNPLIMGEDAGQVFFRFDSGVSAILDANRYNENDSGVDLYSCSPRNTFGVFRIDAMSGHLLMDSCGELVIKPLGEPSYRHDYPRELKGFAGDSCYFAIRHFLDRLLDDEPFETNGTDYLKTLRVVEACYQSSERGLPIILGSTDGA